MNSSKLASGDNTPTHTSPRREVTETLYADGTIIKDKEREKCGDISEDSCNENITPQIIEDNETKLKERIAQCKTIIESLKVQLNEEKQKLNNDKKPYTPRYTAGSYNSNFESNVGEIGTSSMYRACVDSKLLYCDESLIEYEKQLEKYQNTLNMAQNEKKNAIRKQMLAKAFKLKLMEVENQCNIELLRIKQSLQCLEPLQMIVNKWNTNTDENTFDLDDYSLMSNFLELGANSGSDLNKDAISKSVADAENVVKDETTLF